MIKQQHKYIEESHAGTLLKSVTFYSGFHGSSFPNGRDKKGIY